MSIIYSSSSVQRIIFTFYPHPESLAGIIDPSFIHWRSSQSDKISIHPIMSGTFTFFSLLMLTLVVALTSASRPQQPQKQSFIDLTYAFNNETVKWPGRKSTFNVEIEGETPDGVWIASKGFCTSEHTSTHIDAPYHFHKAGRKLDEIPLEDLIDTPGVLIDIYDKVHRMVDGKITVLENYVMTRQDVLEWEAKHGAIKPGSIVLMRTGWGQRWPDAHAYLGDKNKPVEEPSSNATASNEVQPLKAGDLGLNFPGFDSTAATLLTTERGVIGVGSDAISIDAGSNSRFFPAHKIFAKRSVWMLEMVANLHLLPPRGFNLWVVPFKIDRGTGAPTRVLARINN